MKLKTIITLLLLTFALALVACSPPSEEPTDTPATVAPDLDDSVSSDDPEPATPLPDEEPGKVIESEANVDAISIAIMESFPVQVSVNVNGYLADGCSTVGEISSSREENTACRYDLHPANCRF